MRGSKLIALILLLVAFPVFAQQSGGFWFPNDNDRLEPKDDAWGLEIPALGSADECLRTDANGVVSTTTCWNSLSDMVLTQGYFYIGDGSNNPVGTSSLFMTTDGRLGMGTTTPSETFHLYGTGTMHIGKDSLTGGSEGKFTVELGADDTQVQAIKMVADRDGLAVLYGFNGTAIGANTKNVGLYGWASGATTNLGIWIDEGDALFDNNLTVTESSTLSGNLTLNVGWTGILRADSGIVSTTTAGSGDLLAANNLSDLANTSTARTNLGLVIGTDIMAFDAENATTGSLAAYMQDEDINTFAELQAWVTDEVLLASSSINTFNELNIIVADKTLVNEEDSITFDSTLLMLGAVTIDSYIKLGDAKELEFGSGLDYSAGYVAAGDTVKFAQGADCTSNTIFQFNSSTISFFEDVVLEKGLTLSTTMTGVLRADSGVVSTTSVAALSDAVYGSGWNGSTTLAASMNAIYDYLHNFDADDDSSFVDETWYTNILDGTAAFTDFNGAVIDSDNYVADSIDNAHINWADIDFLNDEGDLATDSVQADEIDTINCGRSTTWDATNDEVDADSETYAVSDCKYIEDPTADDDLKSLWRFSKAVTITGIWAESDQTVTFDLQEDDGSPADIIGTDIVPAAGEASTTTFSDASMAAGSEIDLVVTSVANTPTWVSICIYGTYDD